MLNNFADTDHISKEMCLRTEICIFYIKDGYIAVCQKDFADNHLESTLEYITSKENAERPDFFRDSFHTHAISRRHMPHLYRRELLDVARKVPIYDIPFDDYLIQKPYSYLMEHKSMDDVVLLFVDKVDYHIMETDNREIPTAIHVDPASIGLTEEYYNIDKVGYLLRHRPDIKFLLPKHETHEEHKEQEGQGNNDQQENKKIEISHKNEDSDLDDALENGIFTVKPSYYEPSISVRTIHPFVWLPNDADFKKILDFREEIKSVESYKSEYVDSDAFLVNDIIGLSSAKKR